MQDQEPELQWVEDFGRGLLALAGEVVAGLVRGLVAAAEWLVGR